MLYIKRVKVFGSFLCWRSSISSSYLLRELFRPVRWDLTQLVYNHEFGARTGNCTPLHRLAAADNESSKSIDEFLQSTRGQSTLSVTSFRCGSLSKRGSINVIEWAIYLSSNVLLDSLKTWVDESGYCPIYWVVLFFWENIKGSFPIMNKYFIKLYIGHSGPKLFAIFLGVT